MTRFLYRNVSALDRQVFRLGLATHYGIDGTDLGWALDQGVNYLFWTPKAKKVTASLKAVLKKDRESVILATGPTIAYFAGGIRPACENLLRKLGTDYIDVFQLFWLGRTSAWTAATEDALLSLKDAGMIRKIGVSIHDRKRAGILAKESPLDLLMIRYNAAHQGAEKDIFPYTADRNLAVVAYTATRWGALLKRPKNWQGPVMTAGDCYRFCLSHPSVDLVLTGPGSRDELKQNIDALKEKGPLTENERRWMNELGQIVHQNSSRFTFRF